MEKHSQFERTEGAPGLTCVEFDALLTDALDGLLTADSQRRFEAHRRQCATCGPLFAETTAGMNWLSSLQEVEPPANVVHNILVATTMLAGTTLAGAPKVDWKKRLTGVLADIAAPARALIAQPRMAMTGAMAVFSVSLTLNLAGVKLGDLRHIDLRPSAIKEQATMKYYETTSRVVKYYENIRLVYEVESRLQELKRATAAPEEPEQRPPADRKKNETQRQDNKERRQNYYSMERHNVQLAKWSTTELNHSSNLKLNVRAVETRHAASLQCGLRNYAPGRSLLA